ncbi:hypothetical protein [Paractinoplanes atraurantiacus]|uniref:hypothetical protein n=1 Tax=Paractinoplanes atraurantiacus TaxID=1036182 RepID=UPI001177DB66|nr:hypothetical protein [Actinoplanes atraurantiacus]
MTGDWRTTGVSGEFGNVGGKVSGGTGATMNVGVDGTTDVGFTGSEPLAFSAEAAGATIRGQISYSGSVRAAVVFEPSGGGAGQWRPRDAAQNHLRATVKLSEPFSVTLLDNAGIGRLTGGELPGTGDAIDVLPILRGGTYTCAQNRLQVRTADSGPDLSWTFERVS